MSMTPLAQNCQRPYRNSQTLQLHRTEYEGNFIYGDFETSGTTKLQFFSHSEGYVEPVSGTPRSVVGFDDQIGITYSSFKYVFQYRDHLGNVRLSYSDLDLNGAIDPSTEILEEKNYYPFGLEHKGYNNVVNGTYHPYGYNGQEFDESFGLNVNEMTFRQYDPAIGRFNVIDEMAEGAFDYTPYRFAFNNPIFFSDPTGLWERTDGGGYSTNDKDEIVRLVNYLKQDGTDGSIGGVSSFIEDDIAFTESFENGLQLSTAHVTFDKATGSSEMSGLSKHKLRNEIAYYQGRTNYLYNKDDYEMRNRILSGGRDPISTELL